MPASSSGESGLNESEKVASLRALLICAPPRINPAPYGAHLALCLTSSTALGRILRPMLERSMRPMLTKFQLYLSLERLSSTLTLCAYSLRLHVDGKIWCAKLKVWSIKIPDKNHLLVTILASCRYKHVWLNSNFPVYMLRLSTMCALFLDPHLALRRVIAHLWIDFYYCADLRAGTQD